MTAKEMKQKVFSLIEEYYPEAAGLAEDEDVKNKINGLINSLQIELMPLRKIGAYKDITITSEDDKEFTLKSKIDDMYQLDKIELDEELYEIISNTYLKLSDDYEGTFRIYYYKYPTLMELNPVEPEENEVNDNGDPVLPYDETFTFELDPVLLEPMTYGLAGDLLKMDMISDYGRYFYERYRELKSQIDPRNMVGTITISGGIEV